MICSRLSASVKSTIDFVVPKNPKVLELGGVLALDS
jgi:hypothetical protein